MNTVIKVENLSKIYRLGEIGTGSIGQDADRWFKTKVLGKEDPYLKIGETNDRETKGHTEIVYSLRDINFDIQKGDSVGIIGRNGAGKSTLLKILSRVTTPTTGKINIKGRVASLLEVGTGFHPELTGVENIYLNGAILGMRKREIDRKLDEIIDFSGVERYINTPVKRYSSGMYVRLAFSVAAHLDSEILIVDEVLAVGDMEFQNKCFGKIGEIREGGNRTVLFVSHNMWAIRNLCTKGVLLENGLVTFSGDLEDVVLKYLSNKKSKNKLTNLKTFKGLDCEISNTRLLADELPVLNGMEIKVLLSFRSYVARAYAIILSVFREYELAFSATSFYKEKPIEGCGEYSIEFVIPKYLLNPGFHSMDIKVVDETGNYHEFLHLKEVIEVEILDDDFRRGNEYHKGWGGVVSPILDINIIKK
jgi:lipopolysaccharide transport system ATP-binding protein